MENDKNSCVSQVPPIVKALSQDDMEYSIDSEGDLRISNKYCKSTFVLDKDMVREFVSWILGQDKMKDLRNIIEVQTSHGNWNANDYMLGMANGMLFAEAILLDKEPEYLSKPKEGYCGAEGKCIATNNTPNTENTQPGRT